MDEIPNPFRPPRSEIEGQESFWSRAKKFVFGMRTLRQRFLSGERFLEYGVLMYIDVDDTSVIHAALPLGEDTQRRRQQNVSEAVNQVQKMVEQNPELEPDLHNRRLVVHMIYDYCNDQNEIGEPVMVDWRQHPLSAT